MITFLETVVLFLSFGAVIFAMFAIGFIVGYDAGDRDNNGGNSTLVPSLRRIFIRNP